MYCPQCGEYNQLGSNRCRYCGNPFTRAAVMEEGARQKPKQPKQPARVQTSSKPAKSHRGWTGCLLLLLVAAIITIGLLLGAMLINEQVVKPTIADQVEGDLTEGVRVAVDNALAEIDETSPTGEITITESDINQGVVDYGNLGPVNDVTVDVKQDQIQVGMSAYGLSGTYTTSLQVQDGKVVLTGGNLSGPLGMFIPTGELEKMTNETIGRSLNDHGYRVTAIALSEDVVTLTVEQ